MMDEDRLIELTRMYNERRPEFRSLIESGDRDALTLAVGRLFSAAQALGGDPPKFDPTTGVFSVQIPKVGPKS